MNTEQLGIELGDLIVETSDESTKEIEDIISPLGTMNMILFEYVALLLWGATRAASNVLPEEPCKHAINAAFTVVFDALNGIDGFREHPEFNINKYQDFIHYRFDQYYAAWNDNYPTGEGDEYVRRNFSIVLCFIQCCFADPAKFLKLMNEDKSGITNVLPVVGHHYGSFVERVRSILSRY